MEVDVAEEGIIRIKRAYNPITFEAVNGDTLTIAERDEGFDLILIEKGKEKYPSYYKVREGEIESLFAGGA